MRVRPGTATRFICGLLASIGASLMGCGIGWVELTGDGLEVGAGGMTTMSTSSSGGGGASSSSGMGGMGVGGTSTSGTSGSSSVSTSSASSSSSVSSSSSASSSSSSGVPPCFDCLEPAWLQSLNGAGDEIVNDVAVDSQGNVVFVGSINSSSQFGNNCLGLMPPSCPLTTLGGMDTFVVKVNAAGAPLWTITAGDSFPTQDVQSVAIDANNAVFIAGKYDGPITFPGGTLLNNPSTSSTNVFVAKFGADRTHLWSKGFGDEFEQVVGGIAVDSTGNVIVVGTFKNTIDFGCLDGMMMPQVLTSAGSNDIYVAKLSGIDGACIWNRSFGNSADQRAAAVDVDKTNGAVYFTGRCTGVFPVNTMMSPLDCGQSNMDLLVGKLDSLGEPVWGFRFGDTMDDQEGKSIAVGSNGKIAVSGRFRGNLNFGAGKTATAQGVDDAFVVQFDAAGLPTWAGWFGGPGNQVGNAIAIGNDGKVIVTGDMAGAIQFGPKMLTAMGTDAFVLAYDSAGTPICGKNYGDSSAQLGSSVALTTTNEIVVGIKYQGIVDLDYAACLSSAPTATVFDSLIGKFTLKP